MKEDGKDPLYAGYGIFVPFDSRWAKHFDASRNFYNAYVYQQRCVVVEWPAYDFGLLKCNGSFLKVGTSAVPSFIQDALNASANDFHESHNNRLLQRVMIEFDEKVKLDASKTVAAAREGKYLEGHLVAVSVEGKASAFMCFVAARTDTKAKKLNKIQNIEKAKSLEANLAAELDKLGI